MEPGTSPHFLYQQNALRDALVAGVTLNIFNQHCDRVQMANLAQTVNVLQALVLTEEDRMVLTPTYHVFDLYQVHQGATLLETTVTGVAEVGPAAACVPQVSVSASRDAAGRINLTLCNLDPRHAAPLTLAVAAAPDGPVAGRILTAPSMQAHNTFDHPDAVQPAALGGLALRGGELTLDLPPMAVALLSVG